SDSPSWSPDGRTLAFVSDRTDHSFIGLYSPGQAIRFIAASTSRDSQPQWSADGRKIAFLRQPGVGSELRPPAPRAEPQPWELLIADSSKPDAQPAVAITSGRSPVDPILQNPTSIGFRWAADDRLVLMLYRDGFPHLYSIEHPGAGGKPLLLTPG